MPKLAQFCLTVTELYRLIQTINKDAGITVIMVSHNVTVAVKYATHILHLKKTQVFFGTAEEYAKSEAGISFMGGERSV